MGRTEHTAMEGLGFPRGAPGKGANLRRMQSEYVGSSRPGQGLQPSRARETGHGRGFWSTVMDRPPSSLAAPTGSFHGGFPSLSGGASGHVQPSQSFHGTTGGSSSRGLTGRSSSQKRFQCSDCSVAYATTHELSAHRQRHHPKQARPFQCEQCTVCFSQRSHLNQHVRTVHEKVRPHKCNECNKAFGKKYDLVSHKHAVHSNQRPHACEFCDKRFAKRSNLTRHKEKLHPEERDRR